MNKPNIIYIFADQMRGQSTGYAGDPNIQTPYLDKLSEESLNFVNASSTCPICTPYRGSLLTGQYPLTHGLFMNDLCLPDNGHSLGQELLAADYDTAWIGKWHLDGHGRANYIPRERRQGFDYWKVLECTHDYNNSLYYRGEEKEPHLWENYDTYGQTDDAVEYISSQHDKPFALFVSFGTPHDPYDSAPEDLKSLYPGDKLILRENVYNHRQRQAREQLSGYYAHITAIDKCVKKIDEALEKTGQKENTIFIFTSDHGDLLESHCQSGSNEMGPRKQMPYDESVVVPLLLRFPAEYKVGKTINLPLGTPDIMPTLLSLADLEIPDTVEGRDMTKLIHDEIRSEYQKSDFCGVLIASYHPFADWRTERGGRAYRGIRTERYTFVRDLNGPWLLFDNKEDPYQLKNVVNKKAFKKVQEKLDNELEKLLKSQNDAFETPEELRKRWNYQVDDFEEIPYE